MAHVKLVKHLSLSAFDSQAYLSKAGGLPFQEHVISPVGGVK